LRKKSPTGFSTVNHLPCPADNLVKKDSIDMMLFGLAIEDAKQRTKNVISATTM